MDVSVRLSFANVEAKRISALHIGDIVALYGAQSGRSNILYIPSLCHIYRQQPVIQRFIDNELCLATND